MKVKWKCVWRVLKPKVIATLLVLTVGLLTFMSIKTVIDWYSSTLPPANFTDLTLSQAATGTAIGFGWMPMGFFILVGGGVILFYMLIRSLAEELKPCIIMEDH
jgi:hypothetical protein